MLGTGVVWGVVWAVVGTVVLTALTLWVDAYHPDVITHAPYGPFILQLLLFFGIYGGIVGSIFALLLAIAERRHTLEQLSMTRVTAWGVLGGAALPAIGIATLGLNNALNGAPSMVRWMLITMLAASALLGGLCAAGTLAIGRHGQTREAV